MIHLSIQTIWVISIQAIQTFYTQPTMWLLRILFHVLQIQYHQKKMTIVQHDALMVCHRTSGVSFLFIVFIPILFRCCRLIQSIIFLPIFHKQFVYQTTHILWIDIYIYVIHVQYFGNK